jgi:hypothetical protein
MHGHRPRRARVAALGARAASARAITLIACERSEENEARCGGTRRAIGSLRCRERAFGTAPPQGFSAWDSMHDAGDQLRRRVAGTLADNLSIW